MRSGRRILALVVPFGMAVSWGVLPIGRAQEGGLESPQFRWEAPSECPARENVLARVARNLGRPAELRGVATITRGARYELTLKLRVNDTDTERVIQADKCDSLADAAALLAAMAIDPTETLRRRADGPASGDASVGDDASDVRESAPNPNVADAGTSAAVAHSTDAGRAEAESPAGLSAFVRAGGVLDTGTTPSVAPGAFLQGGLSLRSFRTSLMLAVFGAAEARSPRTQTVGADLSLRTATLDGCFVPFAWRPIEPSLCASATLDWVHATAFGAFENLSEDVFWLTLGLSFETRAYLTRGFFLGAVGGAFVPLRQRTFTITGEGGLFTPSPVSFRGSIGPGFVF